MTEWRPSSNGIPSVLFYVPREKGQTIQWRTKKNI